MSRCRCGRVGALPRSVSGMTDTRRAGFVVGDRTKVVGLDAAERAKD